MNDTTTSDINLNAVPCTACDGFGCDDCDDSGWINPDPGPMDPAPIPVDVDPAAMTCHPDGSVTLDPGTPVRVRIASDRYTLGATVDRDNADRSALVGTGTIPDRWALLNANSGRMVTVTGIVLWTGTERRDGIDYGAAIVDTGSALVYVRARADRLAPIGSRLCFRCELVDAIDPGSVDAMSTFDRSALVVGSRGVRSPRLAGDDDSNGIG